MLRNIEGNVTKSHNGETAKISRIRELASKATEALGREAARGALTQEQQALQRGAEFILRPLTVDTIVDGVTTRYPSYSSDEQRAIAFDDVTGLGYNLDGTVGIVVNDTY